MNLPRPLYAIHRYPHGWALRGIDSNGVPIDAVTEFLASMPADAAMDCGIAHHLNQSGQPNTIMVVVQLEPGKAWRKEIEDSLASCHPEEQWWRGLDVGTSSAAIFAVLCSSRQFKVEATEFSKASTPKDAADLGRCLRLLEKFPHWKALLPDVAQAYPDSKWPALIARWSELEASFPKTNALLQEILFNPEKD